MAVLCLFGKTAAVNTLAHILGKTAVGGEATGLVAQTLAEFIGKVGLGDQGAA